VQSTLEFVRSRLGDIELARALQLLPPEERVRLESVVPTGEVAYADLVSLWEAIDRTIATTAPTWIEQSGAFSIQSRGAQLYGGILRKSSPTEFLTQSVSLFRLFYHPGDMVVVEEGAGRAVLRLVGFAPASSLFCRRQTGGLTQALELAAGGLPTTRHVRCSGEGDAFCEWEMTWELTREHESAPGATRGLRIEG
jgi:hypothetical protein